MKDDHPPAGATARAQLSFPDNCLPQALFGEQGNDQIAPYLSEFTILDVGLQSINPETQKEIRRSFSMDRFREGLVSLRRVNPNFNLYLICGLPHETLLSFLQGIVFVLGERPVRMFINELCLLNGTELRRHAAEYGYAFDPAPPYKVYASKWMDRFEIRLANTFSSVLSRRFNLSIRALFPLAPWVKHASPRTGKQITLNVCHGHAAAGTGHPASSTPGGAPDLREAPGADVEILVAGSPCTPSTRRIFGQLQLMGASRLKITGPVQAFADSTDVEQLVGLGVMHYKTFLAPGDGGHVPSGPDGLDGLKHITRTFSIKGSLHKMLEDPELCGLLSDEGPIPQPTYSISAMPDPNAPALKSGSLRFEAGPAAQERTLQLVFDPQVRIVVNAPSEDLMPAGKKVLLVLYALPNGNSIEWSLGRKTKPGDDWHYSIQHIAAQTRFVRAALTNQAVVLALLETEQKSWPAWRKAHGDARIPEIIQSILDRFPGRKLDVVLSGHSGGGSFTFGYLNSVTAIPANVSRIAFLDSNYAYTPERGHDRKLSDWLKGSGERVLCVLAYNDSIAPVGFYLAHARSPDRLRVDRRLNNLFQ